MLRPLQRLSPSFIMLDFLYGYSIYAERASQQIGLDQTTSYVIDAGARFCNEFLEPLVKEYGPVSIANGYVPRCKGPHSWTTDGVGADVAFHNWVNQDKAPVRLLGELDQSGTEYERIISYAGSEFLCLAWKPEGGNRAAFYENVRQPGKKPLFVTHGRSPADRRNRVGLPVRTRRDWRRAPNEPIFHCMRNLRPQHIRVGEFFTLLDMCRNVNAFNAGVSSVLPAHLYTSPRAQVARMMAEVLDEVVRQYGQISIVRGVEPVSRKIPGNSSMHYWTSSTPSTVGQSRIIIAVDPSYDDLEPLLLADDRVAAVDAFEDDDSVYYRIVIDHFTPAKIWTSATDNTGL